MIKYQPNSAVNALITLILLTLALINNICSGLCICKYTDVLRRATRFSSKNTFQHQPVLMSSTVGVIYHNKPTASPRTLTMGLEVKIRIVGRKSGGEKWLESSYSTYETRLKSTNLKVTTNWHKNDEELIKNIDSDNSKNHPVVLLDPLGKMCTSEKFSDDMYKWLEEGGSRLTFVIGGAEGLPEVLKSTYASRMLSLSSLTFTHQFARILLMEQIYRASEIKKGSGYHK